MLHGNGLIRTDLKAFGASDTGHTAILFSHGTFLFVDAAYINLPVLLILLSELDDMSWAGVHTGSAGCAKLIVHHGKAAISIHVDGIEVADNNTISFTKASKGAYTLTGIKAVGNGAGGGAVV
jgi:hypothetical protein